MEKIEYKPLNDRAYDAIRGGLIAGQFKPRQVLVIRTLAQTYGISTTPVREALNRLVGEGQLVMLANRSIAVPDWDPEKFTELFRIRRELEGLAGEMSANYLPPEALAELTKLTDRTDVALRERRYTDYVTMNQQFHFAIYSHSRSPRLVRIIQNLWGEVGVYMNELFARPGYEPHATEEHRLILEALARADGADVRRHLVADITKAAEFLLPRIEELARTPQTLE
ncbi:GntR family transcriptional regulator [Bradyrhizobium jicamae]|uniref:GntR family transcriptional regulator n=1 Tax=Bradyrhizobium jicamae TaxID=280332 RepID=UPI001BADCD56|nr:GntR family transcriptional regulator [Bradyrhizobium jicamae]MBR0936051.1 GntR family transcriptional regulator [Bradyrhizobium jicamae]